MLASTTTDWIVAVGTGFAAIGTVGAVIIALWQTIRQNRRTLKITSIVHFAVNGADVFPIMLVICANHGSRTIRIRYASVRFMGGTELPLPPPKTQPDLARDDSAQMEWNLRDLARMQARVNKPIVEITLDDALGNRYYGFYPGVTRSRFPLFGRKYVVTDEAQPLQYLGNRDSGPS